MPKTSELPLATAAAASDKVIGLIGSTTSQITKGNFLGRGDVANLLDWTGADPTGSNDNTSILVAALAQSKNVFFPAGSWVLDNSTSFLLENNHNLFGELGGASGGVNLLLTGSATDAFQNSNPSAILLNFHLRHMRIYVTGTYTWVFDLNGMVNCKLANLNIEATGLSTGLLRTVKVSGQPSWVNDIDQCRFRIPDGWDVSSTGASVSTARTLDADFGDGFISGSSFTGGLGPIFRGTGGMRISANRFDRAVAGVTFSIESTAGAQHSFDQNHVEVNEDYDILVDGDQGVDPAIVGLSLTNNVMRSNAVTASIYLKRTSGVKLNTVTIEGNAFTTTAAALNAIEFDPTYWGNVSRGTSNTSYNKNYGMLRLGRSSIAQDELTIASGAITVYNSSHKVDTEGNAATDVLDTVNGLLEGEVTVLSPANASRKVIVQEGGNLTLTGGEFRMDGTDAMIALIGTTTGARELFRSGQVSLAFTPTVTFATPGDISITYSQRSGLYSIVGNVLHWSVNLLFDTNAYTTAAGAFVITGLPFSPPLQNHPASIGRMDSVTYQAGDEQMSAYVSTAGEIRMYREISGSAALLADVASFPASTTFRLWLSGSYFLA